MSEPIAICYGCRAGIFWLRYAKTGKIAPIDAEPKPDGNVLIDLHAGTYSLITNNMAVPEGALRYVNHFFTCPKRKQFERR